MMAKQKKNRSTTMENMANTFILRNNSQKSATSIIIITLVTKCIPI